MLQQILSDMFVDPELLAELDDEQKQILFCKMREEQVRRWLEHEKSFEKERKNRKFVPAPKGKSVQFLLSADGQPWTWVMGEHENDKNIDDIMEAETRNKAMQIAEKETDQLLSEKCEELSEKLSEALLIENNNNNTTDVPSKEESNPVKDSISTPSKVFQKLKMFENSTNNEVKASPVKVKSYGGTSENNQRNKPSTPSKVANAANPANAANSSLDVIQNGRENRSLGDTITPKLTAPVNKLKSNSFTQNETVSKNNSGYKSGNLNSSLASVPQKSTEKKDTIVPKTIEAGLSSQTYASLPLTPLTQNDSFDVKRKPSENTDHFNPKFEPNSSVTGTSTVTKTVIRKVSSIPSENVLPANNSYPIHSDKVKYPAPKPPTKPDNSTSDVLNSIHLNDQEVLRIIQMEESPLTSPSKPKLRPKPSIEKDAWLEQQKTKVMERLKEQRSTEIYQQITEGRKRISLIADEINKEQEEIWKEQERKAKEAEKQIRGLARKAREMHRQSSIIEDHDAIQNRPEIKPKPAQATTRSRDARLYAKSQIIEWFNKNELPKKVAIDPKTNEVADWFHGIINREQAEHLLLEDPTGTFLVRLNDRIKGYVISYKTSDRCKHYLIDASNGNYQFFGANQIVHTSLFDLVKFHKTKPISSPGQEYLTLPCSQPSGTPNYKTLLP